MNSHVKKKGNGLNYRVSAAGYDTGQDVVACLEPKLDLMKRR